VLCGLEERFSFQEILKRQIHMSRIGDEPAVAAKRARVAPARCAVVLMGLPGSGKRCVPMMHAGNADANRAARLASAWLT